MGNLEKQGARHNAEMVDELFAIMLEATWVSPTNRIRNAELFDRFELQVRRLVGLLAKADLLELSPKQLKSIVVVCEDLMVSLDAFLQGHLVVRTQAEKALALMLRIRESAAAALTVVAEIPNR